MSQTNPVCPFCGRSDWPEGPKFNGHKSYCKQHPETRPKAAKTPSAPSSTPGPKSTPNISTTVTATTGTNTQTVKLEPVTFAIKEGKREPMQEEIPEFKTPEQEKAEAGKSEPTKTATLAEERKAGVSAIAALILPLFDMANSALAGEPLQLEREKLKLNAKDAEMLAQAIILVDEKHGGPISKTLGSEEYGAEIFLAGVCIGLGIKVTMMLRMRQGKQRPKSAAPSPEEIPRKSPLQEVGESLRNLVTQKKKEEKEEEPKAEGVLSSDDFLKQAAEYQKNAVTP